MKDTQKKYKQYSSRMKEITRWQAIRLKKLGYKNIYIAELLGIHPSTISSWWKRNLKNDDNSSFDIKTTLVDRFGKLLPEELEILSRIAIKLNATGEKRSLIAEKLGLSSGAVVSGWLHERKKVALKKNVNNETKKIAKPKNQNIVYKKLTKRMKDIIHWQLLRLKTLGYETSFISHLLNINESIITNYWDLHKEDSSTIDSFQTETITSKFGRLSIKEKKMLLTQVSYLEKDGLQRIQIAAIIGALNGAVISGWRQNPQKPLLANDENKVKHSRHSQHKVSHKSLNSPKFCSYKAETKRLIRWQALSLISKGYKYSEASKILNIHATTISRWWNTYLKSGEKLNFKTNNKISSQFKKLTTEMKHVLLLQIIHLKEKKYTHKKIAETLGLNSATLVTRYLKEANRQNKAPALPLPDNLPSIGLTAEVKKEEYPKKKEDNAAKTIEAINTEQKNTVNTLNTIDEPKTSPVSKNDNEISENNTCFTQDKKDNSISLRSETKIVKAKDYANYYEAEKLVSSSKEYLAQCEKKVLEIEAKAEKSAELISKEIIKKAIEKGKKDADELLAETNIAAVNAATEYLSSLKESLPDIILNIVNKFIKDYDDKDFIIHSINSAISEITDKQKVKIYVNNTIISDIKERLHEIKYPDKKITLVSDAALNKKDCLIVTKLGTVNANLENQIKKIEECVKSANAL